MLSSINYRVVNIINEFKLIAFIFSKTIAVKCFRQEFQNLNQTNKLIGVYAKTNKYKSLTSSRLVVFHPVDTVNLLFANSRIGLPNLISEIHSKFFQRNHLKFIQKKFIQKFIKKISKILNPLFFPPKPLEANFFSQKNFYTKKFIQNFSGIKTRSQRAKAMLLLKSSTNKVVEETRAEEESAAAAKSGDEWPDLCKSEPVTPQHQQWLDAFDAFNPKQKLTALERLLELCDHTHIKHVHNYIEPKLQRDYISELPRELVLYLLTYIRPKDLFKLAQVSLYWNQIANDPILWKNICKKYRINMSALKDKCPADSDLSEDEAHDPRPKKLRTLNKTKNRSPSNPYQFLHTYNAFKRAYLIDSNVTRNWCTRPLPAALVLKSHDEH
ncbi:F-box WD repeat-containing 7, partial [Brachionus plicatilis]